MKIEGCTALVTRASCGLGRAFADALLASGAAKVYAGVRTPSSPPIPRTIPIVLDVASHRDVFLDAARCTDVDLLINNAGVMLQTPAIGPSSVAALQQEMDVNVYGLQWMTSAIRSHPRSEWRRCDR
jgi:NADP-dependent 3-hydroxy acid dehydrogenase YdfG